MAKRGRPALLDEAKRREVCALLSAGFTRLEAGRYVGCSSHTIRRTANRDPEFSEQLRRAEAATQLHALAAIRSQASHSWRAAAWLLERLHTDRFGRKSPDCITEEKHDKLLASYVDIIFECVIDPEVQQRIARKLSAVASGYQRDKESEARDRHDDLLREFAPSQPISPHVTTGPADPSLEPEAANMVRKSDP